MYSLTFGSVERICPSVSVIRPPPGISTGFGSGMRVSSTHSRVAAPERLVGAQQRRGNGGEQADRDHDQCAARRSVLLLVGHRLRQYWKRRRKVWGSTPGCRGGYGGGLAQRPTSPDPAEVSVQTTELHGREIGYLGGGDGPVLLLVHGMAGTCENWREVIEPLAQRHTVIAPDLPGHGASAAGPGDYSLGQPRGRPARPAAGARPRARDARRPLARRRHRDAVRLPVPRDGRAPRAGLQRRPRA